MNDEKMRVAVYLRISNRERALLGYGLDVQKNKIMDYLKLYEISYSKVKIYVDDGYSAKNMNRPQMNKLISDIKSGEIDIVYIYKLDRLARNVIDTYKFIDMLINNKCSLVAILDRIDIQTANGRLLVGVLAIMAQWELETITERTADGIAQMVEKGKYPYGRLPYGYGRDAKTKDLYIIEDKAAIVRKVFDLATCGLTIKEIQKRLLAEQIDFSTDQIKHMLLNKLYYGEFEFKGKIYKNFIPAIIDERTYNIANRIISKKFKNYGDNVYWFSNKVSCTCDTLCTRKVTVKNKNDKYYYYYCPKCKKRINQNMIANYVVEQIEDHVNDKTMIKEQNSILRKIKRLNKKIEKIHRRYMDDQIDINIYVKSLESFENEKKDLDAQAAVMKENIIIRWNNMPDIEKKSYIDLHIKRLIVDTKRKTVSKIYYTDNKKSQKKSG